MINLKNLIDFLPFEFKDQDTYKVDGKGILERFLEICGSYFQDDITSDIDNILELIEVDKVQEKYLNYLWEFLGELPFARTGDSTGVPHLTDTQIRNLIKYSIPLLKIRGSRQFFETIFDMYGLTCRIVDPTDGEMDKWERINPIYDTEYSRYDKYNYDKIYGCAQCIQVDVTILGHGFTSPTPEFKAFKQSIDRFFDRFLPYNVFGNIKYGFDLNYNYRIVAEPLIPPTIVSGHITEIPIKVTVTSDYDDADLRYQVTGYDPSQNKWGSRKYENESIFYAKKGNQRYYFRSVGDNSVTTYVDVSIDYYTKSYHIYLELVSGGSSLDSLAITGSNPLIQIKATANMNYRGTISPVDVQLLNTNEIKPSGSIWDITSQGTYDFVISEFPSKKVSLVVTSQSTTYRVLCNPRNVNISKNESTTITITTSDPNENPNNLEAVLTTDPSVVVRNGGTWTPRMPGTFLFRCTKDTSGDSTNLGTVVSYALSFDIIYDIGVSRKRLSLDSQGNGSILVWVTSGVYYETFENNDLFPYFNTDVNVYKKDPSGNWLALGSITLLDMSLGGPEWYYGVQTTYAVNEPGTYKFEPVGDPSKNVEVVVLAYTPPLESYLWLEPLDSTDENWYQLEPAVPEDGEEVDPNKYVMAGYQLTKKLNCQFYLRYGNNGIAPVITLEGSEETYKSDILLTFDKPGVYEFYYNGSTVTLTVKAVVPKYSLILEPPMATLSNEVPEVSTIVTCTSDDGIPSDIIYETIPDVAHTSPYQFFTNLPGKHTFYVKDNPSVKAIFLVNLAGIVDKEELVWEATDTTEQEIKVSVPAGTEWQIKME